MTQSFVRVWNDAGLREKLTAAVCRGFLTRLPHLQGRFIERLGALVAAGSDDETIYRTLHDELHLRWLLPGELARVLSEGAQWRAANRVASIMDMLPPGTTIETILDVGCHDGTILSSLGDALEIEDAALYGCDVDHLATAARYHALRPGDLADPALDRRFSLITMLMVLHHLPEPSSFLGRAFELTTPGGFVVVREHSRELEAHDDYFEVLHLLNQKIWPETPYSMSNFSRYMSIEQWDGLFEHVGFERLEKSVAYEPLMAVYRVYRRPAVVG